MNVETPKPETAAIDTDAPKVGLAYFRTGTQSSYTTQMYHCRFRWEREGIPLGATFLDYGVAASTPLTERPGFFALLVRLRRSDVSSVIVDELSRIARDLTMLCQGIEMIEAQGAVVLTANGDRISAEELRSVLAAEPDVEALRRRWRE